jgi:hypothetical protein
MNRTAEDVSVDFLSRVLVDVQLDSSKVPGHSMRAASAIVKPEAGQALMCTQYTICEPVRTEAVDLLEGVRCDLMRCA